MKKLQLLHEYLLCSGLVKPDQLIIVADNGSIQYSTAGQPEDNLFIVLSYVVELTITAFGGDVDALWVALCWWLGLYAPERAGLTALSEKIGVGFEVEIINKEIVNLHLSLPLTEKIRYQPADKSINHCAKPLVLADAMAYWVIPEIVDSVTLDVLGADAHA